MKKNRRSAAMPPRGADSCGRFGSERGGSFGAEKCVSRADSAPAQDDDTAVSNPCAGRKSRRADGDAACGAPAESGKLRGAEGFERYYGALFAQRWPALRAALLSRPACIEWNAGGSGRYFLDPASIYAASQLPLDGARSILDLCAAPGGKTLVIASRMGQDAALCANELSAARIRRLSRVCESCLPEPIRARVRIQKRDGARLCVSRAECYDRILLDAPCSSERHVLGDPKYLAEWSPARVKSLAIGQWALVSSAYRMLSPGGFLLYATCALCPAENDGIIARLFRKFGTARDALSDSGPRLPADVRAFCNPEFDLSPERTERGFRILPDSHDGAGPIWFSLIQKTEA